MTMRDMTDAEMAASQGMRKGNLGPLADLLKREEPDFHPIIQRELWKLLRGDVKQSDYRIEVIIHPQLSDVRTGNVGKANSDEQRLKLALDLSN